jgi:Zn finger protein HypA/HybF involved in hydrogenase expression
MKQLECNVCGESVVMADRGEMVERGETPVEHMERTGHSPRRPQVAVCDDCGNVWNYTGSAETPTCSNCRGKNTRVTD